MEAEFGLVFSNVILTSNFRIQEVNAKARGFLEERLTSMNGMNQEKFYFNSIMKIKSTFSANCMIGRTKTFAIILTCRLSKQFKKLDQRKYLKQTYFIQQLISKNKHFDLSKI